MRSVHKKVTEKFQVKAYQVVDATIRAFCDGQREKPEAAAGSGKRA